MGQPESLELLEAPRKDTWCLFSRSSVLKKDWKLGISPGTACHRGAGMQVMANAAGRWPINRPLGSLSHMKQGHLSEGEKKLSCMPAAKVSGYGQRGRKCIDTGGNACFSCPLEKAGSTLIPTVLHRQTER